MIDDMTFTSDWVSSRDGWWREALSPLIGQPVSMLEVGFYEGRSAQWWLRNLLTHPESRLVSVDRWASKGSANRGCIAADPAHGRKFSFCEQDGILFASQMLASGCGEYFDFVYSDFSKEARDIMTLACLAFRLLRPGGIYLFDDYEWVWTEQSLPFPAPQLGPQVGVDAWLAAHDPFIERVERRRGQLLVAKKIGEPS